MPTELASRLLGWYGNHGRELPWRNTQDPYAIWVSEVMAQQTRISVVVPYYRRWMQRFPTVAELAAADRQEVLALWEGLGYYRRAVNLHRAARIVQEQHEGQLPSDRQALEALPGIGDYTASALLAIVHGKDEVALDGNLRRVISRVLDLARDPRSAGGRERMLAWAGEHLPSGEAGIFNQALMDLGSLVCTPGRPACERCPLSGMCRAEAKGTQSIRPIKGARRRPPLQERGAGVLWRLGRVLIRRRGEDGLLGGLWEFPETEWREGEGGVKGDLEREFGPTVMLGQQDSLEHAYTHFRVRVHPVEFRLVEDPELEAGAQWVRPEDLHQYPMGKLARRIADRLGKIPS